MGIVRSAGGIGNVEKLIGYWRGQDGGREFDEEDLNLKKENRE